MNIKLLQIDLETNDKYILFGIDKFYEFAIEKSKLDNLKIKFVFDFINKNICSKDYSLDDFISSLNKIGRCKLCKNDYEILAKKSHLIPKFLYKNIIKNKDKPIDKFIYKVKEKKVFDPKKISPDGYFENDIFCINCEKIFKYLEDYFSSVVFNKLKNKLTPFREEIFRNNLRCIKFTNFDNKKFKLFLLSILWRLSVSKKIEFVGLNLGRYEDEIGSLIQKNLESESFGYLSINLSSG